MDDFERTEAGNLTDEGIRQYLVDRISNITKAKDEQIKELKKGGYIRHKYNCTMGEYNTLLIGKGCSCGLSEILKVK